MTERHNGRNPKDNADVPPVLPSEQPGGSDGGAVLSPEDLDISNSPYVAEVSEGRYVVSADRSPPKVSDRTATSRRVEESDPAEEMTADPTHDHQSSDQHQPPQETPNTQETQTLSAASNDRQSLQSPGAARSVLAAELEHANARYAVDIVSRLEDTDIRHRTTSDDVVGTFDNLVMWYAQNVAKETPTQRTASLLFERSEFSAPLSPEAIKRTAKRHGLTRSSTIGDLLDALE